MALPVAVVMNSLTLTIKSLIRQYYVVYDDTQSLSLVLSAAGVGMDDM